MGLAAFLFAQGFVSQSEVCEEKDSTDATSDATSWQWHHSAMTGGANPEESIKLQLLALLFANTVHWKVRFAYLKVTRLKA